MVATAQTSRWQSPSWRLPERAALLTVLASVQGGYYALTGVWPLVSIRTFKIVTGPKTDHLPTGLDADHWLAMTVGVLVTAIALSLLTAAWRRAVSTETAVLAVSSATGLLSIDVVYVSRGVIWPIYLIDAAVQGVLITLWVKALFGWREPTTGPT